MAEVASRGRRVWLWIVGLFLLFALAIIVVAVARRSPYAFLDKYHPRRTRINLANYYLVMRMPRPATVPTCTLLEFDLSQSKAVLADLKNYFRSRPAYSAEDETISVLNGTFEAWLFQRGSGPAIGYPDDACEFLAGGVAVMTRDEFLSLNDEPPHLLPNATKGVSKDTCIVWFTEKESWIDRSLASIRDFLHL